MREPCASIDFEGYSEAGYRWDADANKWARLPGCREYGLPAVGAAVYAEHPSTELLCMSYWLPGNPTVNRWLPGNPFPADLRAWVESGRPIKAHNVMFERLMWHHVAVPNHGFPPVHPSQWRCSSATARANGLPGSLDNLGDALLTDVRKDKRGKELIKRFCVPRNPTKTDVRRRILPTDDVEGFRELCEYCDQDVRTEIAASNAMPPMAPDELMFWQYDQEINWNGVPIDMPAVEALIAVMERCLERYSAECELLTGGLRPSQGARLMGWLSALGVHTDSLDAENVELLLEREGLHPLAKRVLEIKALTASASVKKLYSMRARVSADGRLRGLYIHHGARTGRPTGADVQPTNLPKSGPDLAWDSLGMPFGQHRSTSPWTGEPIEACRKSKWSHEAVDAVVSVAATRGFEGVEDVFGDALLAISGSVRGLFKASDGCEFVSSDFSAIEAVVAACSAGEQWRIDTFRRKADIYVASIARVLGKTEAFYEEYKAREGQHHEDRDMGKRLELSLGFGGWLGALRAFGLDGPDDVLKPLILGWRAASPAIVEMWGGQGRGFPGSWSYRPELYGLEGAAVYAIQHPGTETHYRTARFVVRDNHLLMTLPSGRALTYRDAIVTESAKRPGELQIRYRTWNSNPKYGAMGWVWMDTYGGRLFENWCQAVAHDIQRYSIVNQWRAGYRTVLHVYDENCAEVPAGFGSIEEYERIMSTMPPFAYTEDGQPWPIRAAGGYRAQRYRKG